MYHYVARTKSDKGFTVAQFTELFLRCAQVSGVYVNGSTGTAFATTDMFIESRALTAEQVTTRYNNYLSENASYPHNHTWGADNHCTQCDYLNPDHTHIYENGVCTVRGCGMVDPHHEHVYSSALDKYDHCTVCGEINPIHGKTGLGGQKHVYDGTLHCYACGQLDPHHTAHTYVRGECVCGVICEHTDLVDGVCQTCGAKLSTVSSEVTGGTFDWLKPADTESVLIMKGMTTTLTFQYTDYSPLDWAQSLFTLRLSSDPTEWRYIFRYSDGAYQGLNGAWNVPQTGETCTSGGDMQHSTANSNARPGRRVKLVAEYNADGTLTITITEYEASDTELETPVTGTRTFTLTGLTDKTYLLGFGCENSGYVGNKLSVNGPSISWD